MVALHIRIWPEFELSLFTRFVSRINDQVSTDRIIDWCDQFILNRSDHIFAGQVKNFLGRYLICDGLLQYDLGLDNRFLRYSFWLLLNRLFLSLFFRSLVE